MSTIKDDAVETVLRQAKIRGRQLRRRRRVLSMSLVSALVLGTSGIAGLVATAGRTPRSNVPPTSVRPAGTSSTVQMPNVLGMTTAVAEQAISAATSPSGVTVQVTVQNLTADEIANLPPSAAGTVVAQVPSMGGVIDSQSEIVLRVDDPSSPS